jgi:hypothetical protein
MNIGYARVSTEEQDLTVQRNALEALGVAPERIYVDHGLTGTNRERPGLREALAACRAGWLRPTALGGGRYPQAPSGGGPRTHREFAAVPRSEPEDALSRDSQPHGT